MQQRAVVPIHHDLRYRLHAILYAHQVWLPVPVHIEAPEDRVGGGAGAYPRTLEQDPVIGCAPDLKHHRSNL